MAPIIRNAWKHKVPKNMAYRSPIQPNFRDKKILKYPAKDVYVFPPTAFLYDRNDHLVETLFLGPPFLNYFRAVRRVLRKYTQSQ